jgi:hypothetical protein
MTHIAYLDDFTIWGSISPRWFYFKVPPPCAGYLKHRRKWRSRAVKRRVVAHAKASLKQALGLPTKISVPKELLAMLCDPLLTSMLPGTPPTGVAS